MKQAISRSGAPHPEVTTTSGIVRDLRRENADLRAKLAEITALADASLARSPVLATRGLVSAKALLQITSRPAPPLDMRVQTVNHRIPAAPATEGHCHPAVDLSGLTPRERDVLSLVAAGLTNPEISGRLFLGINSVKTYLKTAYKKIGVTRRSQAVLWAVRHGLVDTSVKDPAADVESSVESEAVLYLLPSRSWRRSDTAG